MRDEFSDRQLAIRLRLAGRTVEAICRILTRSREWFHTWWRRIISIKRGKMAG